MKPQKTQTTLKWSKNKEFCPTCRGTGRIQEMVVDNIAKKVLFSPTPDVRTAMEPTQPLIKIDFLLPRTKASGS